MLPLVLSHTFPGNLEFFDEARNSLVHKLFPKNFGARLRLVFISTTTNHQADNLF
jgi:hypothetical protein